MPSLARLVATDTIGRPRRVAAYLATSMVLPPPMPTTASYERARSLPPRSSAASRVPPATVKMSAERSVGRISSTICLGLPRPDHHRHVTAGGDPAVGEDGGQVGHRAPPHVDGERGDDRAG